MRGALWTQSPWPGVDWPGTPRESTAFPLPFSLDPPNLARPPVRFAAVPTQCLVPSSSPPIQSDLQVTPPSLRPAPPSNPPGPAELRRGCGAARGGRGGHHPAARGSGPWLVPQPTPCPPTSRPAGLVGISQCISVSLPGSSSAHDFPPGHSAAPPWVSRRLLLSALLYPLAHPAVHLSVSSVSFSALLIPFLCLSRGPVSSQGPASLLYLSEAFPERLGGLRVDRLGEVCTVGEWLEIPGLRPLVSRTARCRLPGGLTLAPGTPKLWVLRLPAPSAVARTGELREGLAASAHWSLLPMGAACSHWGSTGLGTSLYLARVSSLFLVLCVSQPAILAHLSAPCHLFSLLPAPLRAACCRALVDCSHLPSAYPGLCLPLRGRSHPVARGSVPPAAAVAHLP